MRTRLLILLLAAAGCDGMVDENTVPPGWVWDGGFDEDPDAGTTVPDSGEPVVLDSGMTEPDAGPMGVDSGVPDAGAPDAGNNRPDAGYDGGFPRYDAGVIPDAGPTNQRHTARVLHSTDAGNGFFEYLPPGYGDGTPRPLLVFWHGVGENGDGDAGVEDLRQVLANGPPRLINQNRWSNGWPFVVLSPQHRGGGCPSSNEIRNFIAWSAARYDVDPKRLYLTGLSCGAIGSWNYVGNNLDAQIAAAVLICGDPGNPTNASSVWGRHMCNLGRLPIWSFHGDADTTVTIPNNRETMNRLIACPAPPRQDARFTVYPGVGHDSWSRTYDLSAGHDIYSWLLLQSKP
ncbi:MAG: hypothetical protein JNK82_23310 [Myxococcaceae bacterium]|nr:hypothetical protein [Myxococcaceae bacterium]